MIKKSKTRELLEKKQIKQNEVYLHQRSLTQKEIIDYITPAIKDTTDGSCVSSAFAYTANKAGYNVTDFRGGISREIFADPKTMLEISRFNGVNSHVIHYGNDFIGAEKLFDYIETNKEYILSTGNHSAIVKRNGKGIIEYLELQYRNKRGFNELTRSTLEQRFTCMEKYISVDKVHSLHTNILIEIESLSKNKEFIELLKYINTLE